MARYLYRIVNKVKYWTKFISGLNAIMTVRFTIPENPLPVDILNIKTLRVTGG